MNKPSFKHRFLLWVWTHFFANAIRRDAALAEGIFGRAMNLWLQSKGWQISFDNTAGGLRWWKWTKPTLKESTFPITALAYEFRMGNISAEWSLTRPEEKKLGNKPLPKALPSVQHPPKSHKTHQHP